MFTLYMFTNLVKISNSQCLTHLIDTSVNFVMNGDFETPYLGPNTVRYTTDQLNGWISIKM